MRAARDGPSSPSGSTADEQEELRAELAAAFASRTLDDWLELFDGEDVCVGPVATLAEGAAAFGAGSRGTAAPSARTPRRGGASSG